jgi:putative toxin-antitoxin system antitoxin component (TIGR02293 family)
MAVQIAATNAKTKSRKKSISIASTAGRALKAKTSESRGKFLSIYSASATDRVNLIRKGVPAQSIVRTAKVMGVTQERIVTMLAFPKSTTNRKISNRQSLTREQSERMIGLQKLIGQVESIMIESGPDEHFDAAHWVSQWLEQPLPALGNVSPATYMDTFEGQAIVSGLISQMQSGAYA